LSAPVRDISKAFGLLNRVAAHSQPCFFYAPMPWRTGDATDACKLRRTCSAVPTIRPNLQNARSCRSVPGDLSFSLMTDDKGRMGSSSQHFLSDKFTSCPAKYRDDRLSFELSALPKLAYRLHESNKDLFFKFPIRRPPRTFLAAMNGIIGEHVERVLILPNREKRTRAGA
jgi:hypothetical protein